MNKLQKLVEEEIREVDIQIALLDGELKALEKISNWFERNV